MESALSKGIGGSGSYQAQGALGQTEGAENPKMIHNRSHEAYKNILCSGCL